jgi:hypothetical protein
MISYLEQYNLLVQKELGKNVLTVGYVGMLGRHLAEELPDINYAPPSGTATPNARLYATQLPNVSAIGIVDTEGVSRYNGQQAALQRRYENGLAFDVHYVYARNLDNITGLSNGGGDGYGALPTIRSTYEYGNSDLDLRHRVAGNAIYALPFAKTFTGVKGLLAKNWQVNALAVWETGLPFTVLNSTDIGNTLPNDGQPDRPNMTGNGHIHNPSINGWLDTSAFAVQAVGTLGNEERNQVYMPHYGHLDLSLFKEFPFVNDRYKLQFRAESFNLTNTPTFGIPNQTVYSTAAANEAAGFGTISAMNTNYAPRQLQFVLKMLF